MKMKQKAASAVLIATMMCTQSPIVFAMQENTTNIKNDVVLTESSEVNTVDVTLAVGDIIEDNGITYTITALPSGSTHGKVTLTNGNSVTGDITIPSFITSNGKYDVTELENNAFKGNTELTRIDLSKTAVKKIGQYCFSGCTNLTEAKFTEDTAVYLTIDRRAFENCKALKELQFASVQITTNSALAFFGSGIEKITILNPLQFSRYAFSGLPSGFILNCPHKISTVGNLNAEMFGDTQNVTFLVPNNDLKSRVASQFKSNTKVTVKLANENVEDTKAVVKDNKGQVISYASLTDAFKGINESSNEGPFMIYMSDSIVEWPSIMPNKATIIDFGQNNVELPESITLQAPLTIKNVNNFTNADQGKLCQLNANEHAFVMDNGGSFGFSEIIGDHLTFKERLPGSTSLGKKIQIKGYSNQAQISFENIGRSNYYYNLPNIEGFTSIELGDTYVSLDASQINNSNIMMNDGGMKISGDAKIESLSGNGEIRLATNSSLTVDKKAEGNFTLPEFDDTDSMITVPADSSIGFSNNVGNNVHAHAYKVKSNENKHWLECECGNTKDVEEHTGGKANCHQKAICSVCNEEYGDLDLKNHEGETEIRGQIEAKIGKEGYTGDTYCIECGTVLVKGKVIPALVDDKKEEPSTGIEDKKDDPSSKVDDNKKSEQVIGTNENNKEKPQETIVETKNNTTKETTVKTGDETSLEMGILTLFASLGGILFTKKKRMVK
ncbi:MAG: leucine-rich repeat protein [Bacillota bacterium]|nr:leucine-rich repeat protein [Bacillota bacterium]